MSRSELFAESEPQTEETAEGSVASAPQLAATLEDPDPGAFTMDTPRGPRPDSATLLSGMGLQDVPPQEGPATDAPRMRPLSARVRASRCDWMLHACSGLELDHGDAAATRQQSFI